MKRNFTHALLALALAGFLAPAVPAAPGSRVPALPESSELPLRLLRGYVAVVEGSLGTSRLESFLVDTGTSPTILDERKARQIGLTFSPARLDVLDGSVSARTARLPALRVGPLEVRSLPVLVSDLSALERELGVPIAAIIGLDVLGQSSFELDYRGKRLIFGEVRARGIAIPFAHHGSFLSVPMEVGGEPLAMLVDTGASGLLLFQSRVRNPGAWPRLAESDASRNLLKGFTRHQVRPGKIVLGGRTFGLERAFMVEDHPDPGRSFDGLLGVGALGFRSVGFDFSSGTLYLRL